MEPTRMINAIDCPEKTLGDVRPRGVLGGFVAGCSDIAVRH
jgi:hypothetical protein